MDTPNVVLVAVSAANYGFDRPYSYRIPSDMRSVQPGCRVIVPFGRGNRLSEGIVLACRVANEESLKQITKVTDAEPILSTEQLRLALWMHNRFFCTVYDAVKAILPVGVWYSVRSFYRLKQGVDYEQACSDYADDPLAIRAIETIRASKECSLNDLQIAFGEVDPEPVLKRLIQDAVVQIVGSEKQRVRDQVTKFARLAQPVDQILPEAEVMRRRAPQQAAILDLMCSVGRAPVREICYFTGASAQSLQSLVKKGFLVIDSEPSYRRPARFDGEMLPLPKLTPAQRSPYEGLRSLLDKRRAAAALLFGVTGSGKTAVYLHLMQTVLDRGQSSILLVPEISLTPQMIKTFSSHFGYPPCRLYQKVPYISCENGFCLVPYCG